MRIQVRKARAVKQKVWNEAENRERDLCEARGLCARKTLTARFTDFFTDYDEKNPTVLQSTDQVPWRGELACVFL